MPNSLDCIPTSGRFQDAKTGDILWEELENTAYERTIKSQNAFIDFLQDLHIPDDTIHYPPEGGWPRITGASFAAMGKSDRAIKILRNMAYIEGPQDSSPREILVETALIDYREPDLVKDIAAGRVRERLFAAEPPDQSIPQDVVSLTIGGMGCKIVLLDCKHGIARWIGCGEGRTQFGLHTKGDPVGEGDPDWGGDTAWPVEEFFDYVKLKFVNMEQLSYNQSRLIKKNYDTCEAFEIIKEIYQKHGWSNETYDKAMCMEEIAACCTENRIN